MVMNFRQSMIIAELWRPEIARRWKKFNFLRFWKTTHYGKIFKILFRNDSSRHQSTYCVQILWNLTDRKSAKLCVIYLAKKQNFAWLFSSRYCADRDQNLPEPAPTMYSECSRFHPNRFTFGGVISERVNTIRADSKVNPSFEPNNNYLYVRNFLYDVASGVNAWITL